jgi:hypothetical protein
MGEGESGGTARPTCGSGSPVSGPERPGDLAKLGDHRGAVLRLLNWRLTNGWHLVAEQQLRLTSVCGGQLALPVAWVGGVKCRWGAIPNRWFGCGESIDTVGELPDALLPIRLLTGCHSVLHRLRAVPSAPERIHRTSGRATRQAVGDMPPVRSLALHSRGSRARGCASRGGGGGAAWAAVLGAAREGDHSGGQE